MYFNFHCSQTLIQKFYQQREKHEDVRHEARNELDEYCREIRKKIGKTLHLNDEFKKELPITLSQLKFWHDGTSEEYLKKLEDIKFLIEVNISSRLLVDHFVLL